VTKEVPRQQCVTVPQQQCSTVPRQQCNTVPTQQCSTVPRQQCSSVPSQQEKQECSSIPRQQCTNVPRQQCSTVARQECGNPICQPVYWCKQCSQASPSQQSPIIFPAASQDSYGSPQAAPIQNNFGSQVAPVTAPAAQDSYGSPQAAPISSVQSNAAASSSFGSPLQAAAPIAPAAQDADSYGIPRANPVVSVAAQPIVSVASPQPPSAPTNSYASTQAVAPASNTYSQQPAGAPAAAAAAPAPDAYGTPQSTPVFVPSQPAPAPIYSTLPVADSTDNPFLTTTFAPVTVAAAAESYASPSASSEVAAEAAPPAAAAAEDSYSQQPPEVDTVAPPTVIPTNEIYDLPAATVTPVAFKAVPAPDGYGQPQADTVVPAAATTTIQPEAAEVDSAADAQAPPDSYGQPQAASVTSDTYFSPEVAAGPVEVVATEDPFTPSIELISGREAIEAVPSIVHSDDDDDDDFVAGTASSAVAAAETVTVANKLEDEIVEVPDKCDDEEDGIHNEASTETAAITSADVRQAGEVLTTAAAAPEAVQTTPAAAVTIKPDTLYGAPHGDAFESERDLAAAGFGVNAVPAVDAYARDYEQGDYYDDGDEDNYTDGADEEDIESNDIDYEDDDAEAAAAAAKPLSDSYDYSVVDSYAVPDVQEMIDLRSTKDKIGNSRRRSIPRQRIAYGVRLNRRYRH